MSHGANAYARVAQATHTPRDLEAHVLLKAATRFQAIRDDWEAREKDLYEALTYNRKLWIVFYSAMTREDNPLPVEVRQNILRLAGFVFNHTLKLTAEARPEQLNVLININRDLAAGLRGRGSDAPAPQQAG
jgi:flagellar biosynthesis activator protein FlaF